MYYFNKILLQFWFASYQHTSQDVPETGFEEAKCCSLGSFLSVFSSSSGPADGAIRCIQF